MHSETQLLDARAVIDARGELPYLARVRLLRSFDEPSRQHLGWFRRAALAIVCARECSNHWERARSAIDLGPVLEFAERCMEERSMFLELERVAENLSVEVDNVLSSTQSDYSAAYAGFAAVAAARAVVRDEVLNGAVSEEKVLAVSEWSSAFWASCAFARGAVWEDDTDDEARRRFWLWYLDRAIPRVLANHVAK